MDRFKKFQNERKSSLREPKTSFVKTKLFEECLYNLEKNSLILILGKAGAGKTRNGLELWKEVSRGRDSFIVEHPRELDFFGLTGKFAVFYDDIFGQYAEDVKQTTVWYQQMTKLVNLSVRKKRLKVILTCRTEIYNKCKTRKELDVLKKYIFDLSECEMNEKEKEEIAVMFGLAPSLCQKKSNKVGFPRCCELLTCFAKFKISESDMFDTTSEAIKSYIDGMLYENRAQYYSLFLTLVFGNKMCLVDVNEQDMVKIADIVGVSQQNIRETVSEALKQLDGSLLSCKDNIYSLSNNSLFDIAVEFFVKQYPNVFIKYSDISFLEHICDNFLELDPKSIEQCSRRLIDEKEQLVELKLFRILTNVNVLHHYLSCAGGQIIESFEFFWYLCWAEESSVIEVMLPLMSTANDFIDRCSECCTNYTKNALQLLMSKQDKGGSTTTLYKRLSRDLSDQVGTMSFSNIPLFRVECESGDFPRYRYHYKLTRRLSDNLTKLRSSCPALETKLKQMIPWQQIKESPVVIIGGKRHTDSEWAFISRDKRNISDCAFEITEVNTKGITFSSFENIAPTCLVYYVNNEDSDDVIRETLEQVAGDFVKSAFAVPGASSIIVVMTTIERQWLEKMKIVRLPEVRFVVATDEKSLRGHVTSTLEQTMVEYIQMLKEKVALDNSSSIPSKILKKLDDVKTEIEGVLHRLIASSTLPKIKQTSSHRSMTIPAELQKVLDRNSDKIYGYGFRHDCFFILVSQHLNDYERHLLQKEISCVQKDDRFSWEIKYEWTTSVQFQKYVGQGSPLYPEKDKQDSYGTLGGFAEVNKTDMVGLSSYHVFLCDNVNAFVKDGENIIPLGVCSLMLTPGPQSLADIALIKIDNNPNITNNCEKLLVNDENEPKSAEIYMGSIEDLIPGIVHKKGATTGITQGAVVEHLQYRELLGERETKSMFIVRDMGEEFCKRGDSGSLVFRNDLSVDQTGIEVIAILSGRFQQNSDHILCSSMKYIFEKLKADGKTLRFFTKDE